MITWHDIEQGTEEWHAARAGKFTGSNAYKLLSSFGANEYARAIQQSFSGNFYTKRGHVLEDEALELFEAIFGTKVERPGFVTNTEYPECLYSPDGVSGPLLLEVKCFNVKKHMEMVKGKIDLKIKAQIHFGMLITGLKEARLVIYNPDPEIPVEYALVSIPVAYDRAIASNFKRILKGQPHGATT